MTKKKDTTKTKVIPTGWWIVFALFFCGIIVAFILFNSSDRKTLFDLVGLLSAYITVVGFIVAIREISALKSSSEAAKSAIQETKDHVDRISVIVDCSKVVELLRQTEANIRQNEILAALFLLQEEKDIICRAQVRSLDDEQDFQKHIKAINEIISQFNRFLIQPEDERSLNKEGLIDRLEAVVDFINGLYNKKVSSI